LFFEFCDTRRDVQTAFSREDSQDRADGAGSACLDLRVPWRGRAS